MSTVKVDNQLVNGPEDLIRILERPSGNPDAEWGPEVELFLVAEDSLRPISGDAHIAFVKGVRRILKQDAFADIDISAEPPPHMLEFKMNPMRLDQSGAAFRTMADFQGELAMLAKDQGIKILPIGVINHISDEDLIAYTTPAYDEDPEWGQRASLMMQAFKRHAWREAVPYPVKHACVQMNTSHSGPSDMLEDTLLKYTLLPFAVTMCESALPFRYGEQKPYYNHMGMKDRYLLEYKALVSGLPFEAEDGYDYLLYLAERAYYETNMIFYCNEDGQTYTIIGEDEKAPTFSELPRELQTMKNLVNAYNLWWNSVKHPIHPMADGSAATHNEGRDKDSGPSTIVDTFILEAIPANDYECREAVMAVLRDAGYRLDEPRILKMQIKQDLDFLMQERHHFIRRGKRIADIPMADTTYGALGASLYDALKPYVAKYMGEEYLETFERKCKGETNAQWLFDNCRTHDEALQVMRDFNCAAYGEVYTNFAQLEDKGYLMAPRKDTKHKPEPK